MEEILAAIEANRAPQARKLMRQHISRSGELVARLHERNEDVAAA